MEPCLMSIADERAEPFKRATWIRYINGVLFEHFEKSEISVDGGGLDRAKNQKSRDFQIDRRFRSVFIRQTKAPTVGGDLYK